MGSSCSNSQKSEPKKIKKCDNDEYKPLYNAVANCYCELFKEIAGGLTNEGWKTGKLFLILSMGNCEPEDKRRMFALLMDLDIDEGRLIGM